jgi:hypothetical protein
MVLALFGVEMMHIPLSVMLESANILFSTCYAK